MQPTSNLGPEATRRIIEEHVDDAIIVAREDMTIVYVNRAAELLFGYDRSELLGRDIKMLVPPARVAAHEAQAKAFWSSPDPQPVEVHDRAGLTALDKQGNEFPVSIKLSPFVVGKDRMVTTIVREPVVVTPLGRWDKMVRNIKLSYVLALMALFCVVYAIGTQVSDPVTVYRFLNPVLIAVGVGILVSYLSSVAAVFRSRIMTPGHLLVLGIFFNWFGIVGRSVSWYLSGKTPPPEDIWMWLTAMVFSFIGGALHITAVEAVESEWPPKYFIVAGITTIVVLAYTLLL